MQSTSEMDTKKIIPVEDSQTTAIPLEVFNNYMAQSKSTLISYLEGIHTGKLEVLELAIKFVQIYEQWTKNDYQMHLIQKHSPINFIFISFLRSFVELAQDNDLNKDHDDFKLLFEKAYTELKILLDGLAINIEEYSADYAIYDRIHALFLSVVSMGEA